MRCTPRSGWLAVAGRVCACSLLTSDQPGQQAGQPLLLLLGQVERLEHGLPTTPAWSTSSDDAAAADAYRVVGSVWDLALETGGPLADAVEDLTGHLREQVRLNGRLEALAAGPRASARLLTLLPVVGPALAVLIGADPADLYLSSPVASGSAVAGLMLTVLGWRWSRAMVRSAARPRRYAAVDPSGEG